MQSQRWIFTSPGGEDEYKKPSIARQHYGDTIALKTKQKMEKKETENEKKRREFERCTWEKMTEKVLDQMKEDQNKLKKLRDAQVKGSLYGDSYVKPGFKVKELGTDIDDELVKKYPLYMDPSKSTYLMNIFYKTKARTGGHRSYETMFRRNNQFTSRLSDPNDIHAPVGPGHFAYI